MDLFAPGSAGRCRCFAQRWRLQRLPFCPLLLLLLVAGAGAGVSRGAASASDRGALRGDSGKEGRRLVAAAARVSAAARGFGLLRETLASEPADSLEALRAALSPSEVALLEGRSTAARELEGRLEGLQQRGRDLLAALDSGADASADADDADAKAEGAEDAGPSEEAAAEDERDDDWGKEAAGPSGEGSEEGDAREWEAEAEAETDGEAEGSPEAAAPAFEQADVAEAHGGEAEEKEAEASSGDEAEERQEAEDGGSSAEAAPLEEEEEGEEGEGEATSLMQGRSRLAVLPAGVLSAAVAAAVAAAPAAAAPAGADKVGSATATSAAEWAAAAGPLGEDLERLAGALEAHLAQVRDVAFDRLRRSAAAPASRGASGAGAGSTAAAAAAAEAVARVQARARGLASGGALAAARRLSAQLATAQASGDPAALADVEREAMQQLALLEGGGTSQDSRAPFGGGGAGFGGSSSVSGGGGAADLGASRSAATVGCTEELVLSTAARFDKALKGFRDRRLQQVMLPPEVENLQRVAHSMEVLKHSLLRELRGQATSTVAELKAECGRYLSGVQQLQSDLDHYRGLAAPPEERPQKRPQGGSGRPAAQTQRLPPLEPLAPLAQPGQGANIGGGFGASGPGPTRQAGARNFGPQIRGV
eukprot:TRINITY_DN1858_c0_g1_i1.p1 TRINITY_DN1858_c0_g1~~TRINITY_DN1858_c0_g1_i1.p1  ORF type:complete len:693 (-),score=191.04 TRINITY_DN1858_c0_g1_i1:101-2053(-)